MTIKQLGGIFGRNPTFEDVTIEGTLTFDGDIDVNSDLKVAGDIETTGNVIIATSGKGIDFSATSGTGTSELFDDYEEGTWTPSLVAGVGTLGSTSTAGTYTKVGRVVTLSAYLKITDNGTGSTYLRVDNLPFPVASYGGSTSAYENAVSGSATSIYVVNGALNFQMWKYNNTYPGATNATWYVSVSYFTS